MPSGRRRLLATWSAVSTPLILALVAMAFLPGALTVLGLAAIGMAAGMGATEIHTWGMEYYFPDGEQHWDGAKPYLVSDRPAQTEAERLIQFDIDNGEYANGVSEQLGFPNGRGSYYGTDYFCRSAEQILNIMDENAGIRLIDHSGGLLTMLG